MRTYMSLGILVMPFQGEKTGMQKCSGMQVNPYDILDLNYENKLTNDKHQIAVLIAECFNKKLQIKRLRTT